MQTAPWTDWLEARLGHWAIPRITKTLIVLNIVVYILLQFTPSFIAYLVLNFPLVLQGEAWRLFTFIIVPQTTGVLWFLLYLYFLWWIGNALEYDWGAFKINLYFLIGMAALWVVAFSYPRAIIPQTFLMSSLIVAFGTSYPDETIYIFPLPFAIKAKYIAMFSALMSLISGWGQWAIVAASYLPYILFFLPTFIRNKRIASDSRKRMARFKGEDQD